MLMDQVIIVKMNARFTYSRVKYFCFGGWPYSYVYTCQRNFGVISSYSIRKNILHVVHIILKFIRLSEFESFFL